MITSSLCMIVKDAERSIADCLRSAMVHPFDQVVIVDTGSTDGTKEAIRSVVPDALIFDFLPEDHPEAFLLDVEDSWKDPKVPGPFSGKPMLADFGAARQFGWSRATGDYLMWLDSDDVLEGGEHLVEILSEMERDHLDAALINYDYAFDGRGNPTLKLARERIVRRGLASWKQPIHEVLVPIGAGRFFDGLNVRHRRAELGIEPENAHRNLKVLLRWFESHRMEDPDADPRMIFYLAMEERFIWPARAVAHIRIYCQRSGWDEERGVARYLAGQLLEGEGKHDEAFIEYAQASMENLRNPDPLFGAARVAYFQAKWSKCIEWTERGFAVSKEGARSVLMHDPLDRVYRPHLYYNVALNAVGRVKDALASCIEGLRWNSDDPHLKANKELYERHLAGKEDAGRISLSFKLDEPLESPPIDVPLHVLSAFALQLWKRNKVSGNDDRASSLLDSLPEEIRSRSEVRRARDWKGKIEARSSGADWGEGHGPRVLFWIGPAWERWSPRSIDEGGIGGSETAAVRMARGLRALGCRVIVLSDIDRRERHDGVLYVPYAEADGREPEYGCEIFVCSRQVHAFERPWRFDVSFLWVHDVHAGQPDAKVGECLLRADRILALSSWHKGFLLQTYPFVHPDTIIVTRNAIDASRFRNLNIEPKTGNRLIYSSSPDRGLDLLLDLFPLIRAEVSDAELGVYYGFSNWRRSAELANNRSLLDRITALEARLREIPGVTYHGRVSQRQLACAFATSKVLAYPTWFSETSCISALEAQAAGCVVVSTALAALPETVKHGILLEPPSESERYRKDFVASAVDLLRNDERRRTIAEGGRRVIDGNDWSDVAREWKAMFDAVSIEKRNNPLPRFGRS